MTTYNSAQELAAARAAAEFEEYRKKIDADERQRQLEQEMTAAVAAHRDARANARTLTDTAVGKHSVKIAAAVAAFRSAVEEINAAEDEARKTAVEARAALHPSTRRSTDLGPEKDHGKPLAAGHVVAGVLERIQREQGIALPEKHWSQI